MEKVCTKCQQSKPLKDFGRYAATNDGYNWRCRECVKQYQEAWRAKHRESIPENKPCSYCEQIKPINEFCKDKHSKDGFTVRCRACLAVIDRARRGAQDPEERRKRYREYDARRREARKEYRASRREERNAYNAAWQKNNLEKYRAKQHRWEQKNRAKVNAYQRKYRKARPEYFRAKNDDWARRNPEKVRAIRVAMLERRRARLKAAEGTFKPTDIRAMLIEQNGLCYACHADIAATYTIDHIIPLALGGSNHLSNIELLCQSCNSSKGAKHPIDWCLETGKRVRGFRIEHAPAA